MRCESCGLAAASMMVCGNCGEAGYCSKEHQRAHWPEHKPHCLPCSVQRSPRLGRFLAVSKAVPEGTLLVDEWPLVVGPGATTGPVCLGCHCVFADRSRSCSACGAPVCDKQCEKLAAHSRWECKTLTSGGPPRGALLAEHPELVLPLRCLIGVRALSKDGAVDPRWAAFLQLEAHLERRRQLAVWSHCQDNVVEVLRAAELLAKDGSEDELVQRICGILDVNTFEVRGPARPPQPGEPLRALFLRAALLAHSCQPNCLLAVDDQLRLTVRSSCDLPRGAAVYYNYCELLETTRQRQEHLSEGKYFDCQCARCLDPTEGGTFLSSLWCPRCKGGVLVPPVGPVGSDGDIQAVSETPRRPTRPLPPSLSTLPSSCTPCTRVRGGPGRGQGQGQGAASAACVAWRCLGCGARVAASALRSALLRCSEAWAACRGSPDMDAHALEELEARLGSTLAPRHALLLAVKQVLVAMYRDQALAARRPPRPTIARMRQLCEEILDVLDVLLPGKLSRLKGIAFHELHVAVVLASDDGYLERARHLLLTSLHHLQHEPRDSPEGQLHQLACQELAAVEESLVRDLEEEQQQHRERRGHQRRQGRRGAGQSRK